MAVLPACTSVHRLHARYLQRPEVGVRSPVTGVPDGSELPCGYWELDPGPLEEQPMLLTTEPSLQPLNFCFCFLLQILPI